METFASLVGGLGLFLIGIKAVGTNLQQLAGSRLRAALAAATRGPVATAGAGLVLGGLTQSSNAVTFITTSLVTAGLLRLRAALGVLAWANVGTAGLVMLATVDLRLAVLWVMGVVGFLSAFGLDRGGRLKPTLGALIGIGLLFLGLDLVKAGAAPLAQHEAVRETLALAGASLLAPFVIGLLVTMAAQSSATVTILALTLHEVGLLGFGQTVVTVYGASLGSGIAVLLLAAGVHGSARRLPAFQALFKAVGVALFGLLFLLEHLFGLPLVMHGLEVMFGDAAHRIGWLFLLLQLGGALPLVALLGPTERLLARLCPETEREALARPEFLYDRALDDPATALELVEREQIRLLQRMPRLLEPLREEAAMPGPARRELFAATASVERAAAQFLSELLARGGTRRVLERAVTLENRAGLLAALRETLGEFGDTVQAASAMPALTPLLARLVEALHLLLEQLAELGSTPQDEDAALLLALTADRSEMMDQLRRRLARAEPELSHAGQDLLFRATAQYERAVWLARRLTLVLAPEPAMA